MALRDQPYIEYNFKNWESTSRYSYSEPPQNPGVYVFAKPEIIDGKTKHQILYIGSTKNIFKRYAGHEKRSIIKKNEGFYRFYFMECDDYIQKEKELIKKLQPKYNII